MEIRQLVRVSYCPNIVMVQPVHSCGYCDKRVVLSELHLLSPELLGERKRNIKMKI